MRISRRSPIPPEHNVVLGYSFCKVLRSVFDALQQHRNGLSPILWWTDADIRDSGDRARQVHCEAARISW